MQEKASGKPQPVSKITKKFRQQIDDLRAPQDHGEMSLVPLYPAALGGLGNTTNWSRTADNRAPISRG